METDIFFVLKNSGTEILSLGKTAPHVWHNVRQAESEFSK
jgi:hypothetical protein